ncbi:GDP-Man:Man-PP-Dol alpha-1,2-mannosyltransferase [Erysiphe neolycopersici]|uniref:GDP-Man:Man(3)GlcNAc(2)-PP-Dol alpha-1,2-mannosyltransferase n=1 Tax=Erysiphe neolycopersici TaxID=212602 RepID=A0A420HS18_9PEZI|nr:GDP-Man:Man-PP-Dol alpha-1,2-mannosyltransferase [Erysiphe neolycopersici]
MILITLLSLFPIVLILLGYIGIKRAGKFVGDRLLENSLVKRSKLLQIVAKEEKEWEHMEKGRRDSDEWENVEGYNTMEKLSSQIIQDLEWDGIVGFFHPFCNAGGGGERVLWAAIQAMQKRWPKGKFVVYTGDQNVNKEAILNHVQNRFNISLHPPSIEFLYLTTRSWVLSSSWPHFTLLGQSIGSLVLAWDAFSLLVPDIFIDTMGYAFSLAFCKYLFPNIPTGAYIHYPTISTDMLSSLTFTSLSTAQGLNGGKGLWVLGIGKRIYWRLFAKIYSLVGGPIDLVMTNSSWTQEHIMSLWGSRRSWIKKTAPLTVYPPVAVEELVSAIEISVAKEKIREPIILYLGQFRPEKNHRLILKSFAKFKDTGTSASKKAKLVLIGSIRDNSDSARVHELQLLVNELKIMDNVIFELDATWTEVLKWLGRASIGVNGMWNEHFGIGIVEYQAAGLIPVVHNSGGPKRDIVKDINGQPTGLHASTAEEYAACYEELLSMSEWERVKMRQRARKNTQRFTEEVFSTGWIRQAEKLVDMSKPFVQKKH